MKFSAFPIETEEASVSLFQLCLNIETTALFISVMSTQSGKQKTVSQPGRWIRTLAGLVIELDGAQHLADAEAYRSDRRKDALLQQNGYFVLRFLAEDVGKHLDLILDVVMATLVHRGERKDADALSPQHDHKPPVVSRSINDFLAYCWFRNMARRFLKPA